MRFCDVSAIAGNPVEDVYWCAIQHSFFALTNPMRSAHLHASAVGLANIVGWRCPLLEHHCRCRACGILEQHLHGPNRFPCPET